MYPIHFGMLCFHFHSVQTFSDFCWNSSVFLQLLDGMVYSCQVKIGWQYFSGLLYICWFSVCCSIHCCKWGIQVSMISVVIVQLLGCVWLLVTPWTAARRILCLSLSFGVCSDSCPLSWLCYLTISSSATLFSFCLQSFPASGSFPVSHLFTSGDQSVGASAWILPMNIQS